MCGVAGFVGEAPDEVLWKLALAEAGERGPHSWGVGWYQDWPMVERGQGPLQADSMPLQAMATGIILAHSRLATSGSVSGERPPVEEGQPIVVGLTMLVHNGRIPNAADLALRTWTVDSEVLGQLIDADTGDLEQRVQRAVDDVTDDSPMVALVTDGDALVAVRRAGRLRDTWNALHPLYRRDSAEGVYLCSRPIPGAELIPEGVWLVK
jgi:predicted glutamine amidotransferase